MEWAKALMIDPAPLERDIFADDLHDVRAVADLGDLVLRDQSQLSYSKFLGFLTRQPVEAADPKARPPSVKEKAPACPPSTPYYGRVTGLSQIQKAHFGNNFAG
jgi:hypothetical protein